MFEEAISQLKQAGVETAKLDAELLLAHVLGISRTQFIARKHLALNKEQQATFLGLLERRLTREPIAYILGKKEFWSLDFNVSPAVLCPRPDTEIIVEAMLKHTERARPLKILDLGTGSGAILLSLLSELPLAHGTGVDCSKQALDLAHKNAEDLGLANRTTFLLSNWCERLSDQRYDLIVSNPPYIESEIVSGLEPEVAQHEPNLALDGGLDGLDKYRELVPQIAKYLTPGGWCFFEIGSKQARFVQQLMSEQHFEQITVTQDYQGLDRCVYARRA